MTKNRIFNASAQNRSEPLPVFDLIIILLLACATAISALFTWDHSGSPNLFLMRQFNFPFLLVECVVITLAIFRRPQTAPALSRVPTLVWPILIVAVTCAWLSVGEADASPRFALLKTLANTIHLLFGLSMFALASAYGPLRKMFIIRALLLGFGSYLILVIIYIATAPEDFRWQFFGMTAQNIRNLGCNLMIIGAFAIGTAIILRDRWRWAAVVVATTALALLAWSGSRGSYFILLLVALAGTAFLPSRGRWNALILIGSIFLAGSLTSLIHHVDHPAFGLDRILGIAKQSVGGVDISSGRLQLWQETLALLEDVPLWGYGDGQFYHISGGLAFPHNVVLQLWFQWGWIGGSAALLLIAWLAISSMQKTIAHPDARLPYLMIIATIGAYGFIDGPFYDTLPMIFFAMAAALCLAPHCKEGTKKKA